MSHYTIKLTGEELDIVAKALVVYAELQRDAATLLRTCKYTPDEPASKQAEHRAKLAESMAELIESKLASSTPRTTARPRTRKPSTPTTPTMSAPPSFNT